MLLPACSCQSGPYYRETHSWYASFFSFEVAHIVHAGPPGKTQSLPASYFSASFVNSAKSTLELAQQQISEEVKARNERELQPYGGLASAPRPGGQDASNPFHAAPLNQDVFNNGDGIDWDNDFDVGPAAAASSSPQSGFAPPTLGASPVQLAKSAKRTRDKSEVDASEHDEEGDLVPELQNGMAVEENRQIRPQPKRQLRAYNSLSAISFFVPNVLLIGHV